MIAMMILLSSLMQESFAQQVPFSVTLSRQTLPVNEQLQINFKIDGEGKNFKKPAFANFNVLSGPNRSSSIQIVNGKRSQSQTLSFIIQPKKTGKLQIEAARVSIDGKTYQSTPYTVTVTAASSRSDRKNQHAAVSGVTEKNIFIKTLVSKRSPYIGEGIKVSFVLYANVNIVNYGVKKLPALSGFWSDDITSTAPLQLKNKVIDGVAYKSATLKEVLLFPQQGGELEIDPFEVEFIARIQQSNQSRNNDPFAMFFGRSKDVRYIAKSPTVKLNVKRLPSGAPPGFKGAVGNFSFKAALDKTDVTSNEPVALNISVRGTGNLNLIDPPSISIPADIESYDPKIKNNYTAQANSMSGSKSFEYLLIPRLAGNYEIEPVSFSYFDIGSGSYKSFSSDKLLLQVAKGSDEQVAVTGSSLRSDFELLNEDIRFIKSPPLSFIQTGSRFYGSGLFYLMLVCPILLFGASLLYKGKIDEMNKDVVGTKMRKATKIAHKNLKKAAVLLKENKSAEFYEEISKALWGYLTNKLNIELASLSLDNALEKLSELNVSEETRQQLRSVIENCEMARFSSATADQKMNETYENSVKIIEQVEGEIK